jgi:hypothetical protein
MKCVVRTGAYVGEVMRKHLVPEKCHWIAYDEAYKIDPASFSKMGRLLGNSYSLYHGNKSFSFPLGKIHKRLVNGTEDNVWTYASVVIDMRKKNQI